MVCWLERRRLGHREITRGRGSTVFFGRRRVLFMGCGEEGREVDPVHDGDGLILLPGSRDGKAVSSFVNAKR